MFGKKKQAQEPYDSTQDTMTHIRTVQGKIGIVIDQLYRRAVGHDKSKLEAPEKATFDEMTPKLKGSTYGSEKYKRFLEKMRPALRHHYYHNRHHPEHFDIHMETGFTGISAIFHMNLIDLIEMFCDWAAAVERHDDGDLRKSIAINAERFHLDAQLVALMKNTVDLLQNK